MLNFLRRNTKTRFLFFLLSDIFLIAMAVLVAFLIRFEGSVPVQYENFVTRMIILAIVFTAPIFYFSKLYNFSWAYASATELVNLFKATTISFIFLAVTIYVSKYFPFFTNFPRSVIFISYFLVFILCGALRFSKRIYLQQFVNNRREGKNTLIVGAGDAGEQILRNILSSKGAYKPVGFLDDNQVKQGILIHGLKVLGKINDIPDIIKQLNIETIIIALASVNKELINKVVDLSKGEGVKDIKIIPSTAELINGRVSITDLRNVEIEDLLFREKISLDVVAIGKFIKGKNVLITGAAGSIGSELSRQVGKLNPKMLLILDWEETGIFNISEELKNKFPNLALKTIIADIKDKQAIGKIFKDLKPDIVFHAAAYKHVPLMEAQPEQAVKNNILGTMVVASAAIDSGVDKFIFISTDKAVSPSSVMGATKRVGEMICQTLNQRNSTPYRTEISGGGHTKFVSVRFGNVLNSRGSVIPTFKEQIKRKGPIEVTHPEMKRYFMLISEACLLVMQAGAMGNGGEVFVLDMGKPIKILDLAKEMIKLSGFEVGKDIKIVFTKPRPGEKLFEDILMAEEGTIATKNERIFTAKLSHVDQKKLNTRIGELEKSLLGRGEDVVACLKEVVPFYKSEYNN